MRRFEVHKSVRLSNSFIEDPENLSKFYDKHKDYIKSKSKNSIEEA